MEQRIWMDGQGHGSVTNCAITTYGDMLGEELITSAVEEL